MRRVWSPLAALVLVATAVAQPGSDSPKMPVAKAASPSAIKADSEPPSRPKATTARKTQPKKQADKPFQVGKASWYGKRFHGRTTANGESFDMFQFTAAHRTLPLGTWVKVTNMRNGRWVLVRVNDRGPYAEVESRIIDVSYGAAQMLGFRGNGLVKVRLDLVEPPIETAQLLPAEFSR